MQEPGLLKQLLARVGGLLLGASTILSLACAEPGERAKQHLQNGHEALHDKLELLPAIWSCDTISLMLWPMPLLTLLAAIEGYTTLCASL